MEIFLIIGALAWLAQNATVEREHARRGTTSPRWQAKLMKMEREGRPGYAPRYGSRDWVADLWGDFLKAKTDARRASVKRKGDSFAERLERMREAYRKLPTSLNPETEVQGESPKPESKVAPEEPTPGYFRAKCVNCGDVCFIGDYDPDGGPVWCKPCRDLYPRRGSVPTPVPNPDVADKFLDALDANVIPIFRKADKEEKEDMTVSTEVTGLDPAIHYAERVAEVHETHAAGGGETYVNGLADAGVGQETLAAVRAAQEATSNAAAHWRGIVKRLTEENKGVQQEYINNPNAGDKPFQTGGR